jgi:hypothetical protein
MVRSTLKVLVVATVLCLPACHDASSTGTETAAEAPTAPVADKPFVAAGKIDLDLDGGGYEIKAAADNHIRVAVSDTRTTKVDVAIAGSQANVKIKDTPHSNFHAIVEVPTTSDVVVRLSGGELKIDAVTGNKDVESYAGNVRIAVGDPNDYAQLDAAVKAGELDASPFGGSKSGLMQEFAWSGHGKYTLRAHLGAGNLVLTRK